MTVVSLTPVIMPISCAEDTAIFRRSIQDISSDFPLAFRVSYARYMHELFKLIIDPHLKY